MKTPSLILLALGLSLLPGAWGQAPLSNLVFSVGTTTRDGNGRDWSYVVLSSPQPELIAGRTFAIFGKSGLPSDAGVFSQRGDLFPQTDPVAANVLLSQSASLGEDLPGLGNALTTVLRKIPGAASLPLEQQVVTALLAARTDPAMATTLGLVERSHPGMLMCAGLAFAEPIISATTYEIREINPATGAPADLVGRVSILPGAPVLLPAPGAPFQVRTNLPNDLASQVRTNVPSERLRIRLRWGTPDELRRLSLLSQGFNLWRIPRAAAEAAGYQLAPPSPDRLIADGNFVRVNQGIVTATRDFLAGSGPGAADDPADPTTFFFTDDNGQSQGRPTFADGAEFYYFVTARDLLGRDGLVSPGTLGRACRSLRPLAPMDARVINDMAGADQRLLVSWKQNTNAADLVTEYWVYRWANPSFAFTNDAVPLSNRVAVVASVDGLRNSYLDVGPGAPATPGVTSYWYTVRAVSQAACDPLLSPHSSPAWGVLRERQGPDAATGRVYGSCGRPAVLFQNFNDLTNSSLSQTQSWAYRFTCQRRDPGIAWVQFLVTNQLTGAEQLGPFYFAAGSDTASIDYALSAIGGHPQLDIGCQVGTYQGLVSRTAVCRSTNVIPSNSRREASFFAGQILETAMKFSDPLVATLSPQGPQCYPGAATTHAGGTVRLSFSVAPGTPLMIRALKANTYEDLGLHYPDANNAYWVAYPACLIGPMPAFQGCDVGLPSGGDCATHVTASGDGTVAPLRVEFAATPRTHEYRIYRSVDSGPLSLVAQGVFLYDPANPQQKFVWNDDALPSTPAQVCYFVQLLDEHGNGSPMASLGCKPVAPPALLPQPTLAEPQSVGDVNNPQVALNWFCPTGGVYRFKVLLNRVDQGSGSQPTGFQSPQMLPVSDFDPQPAYIGLSPLRKELLKFNEAQLTPPVGPGFGPGPGFNLGARILPNVTYTISVAALPAVGSEAGPASKSRSFTWSPPVVLPEVPWPKRSLPPAGAFDTGSPRMPFPVPARVAAVVFTNYLGHLRDQRYPVGIRFADLLGTFVASNIGTTTQAVYTVSYGTTVTPELAADPNQGVFRRYSPDDASRHGNPLLPIVVYRQQVANAAFPRVSGSVTQVTPLLERVPWTQTGTIYNLLTVTIPDRLIALDSEFTPLDHNYHNYFYLRDQQPVIAGARYQYFVVRFDDKQREIAETIPAGTVDIPAQF